MRLRAALVLSCALGCSKSTPVTAPGTLLVEWDSTKATRADFAKATVGTRTPKDYTVTVSPKDTPPFKLAVHLETAPVDYTEGGKPVHQLAPVGIKVTVKDNTGWELSAKCDEGPNYQMPSVGPDGAFVTPLGMIQDCYVKEHRESGLLFTSSWAIGFSINAHGDGTIHAFGAGDVKVE